MKKVSDDDINEGIYRCIYVYPPAAIPLRRDRAKQIFFGIKAVIVIERLIFVQWPMNEVAVCVAIAAGTTDLSVLVGGFNIIYHRFAVYLAERISPLRH